MVLRTFGLQSGDNAARDGTDEARIRRADDKARLWARFTRLEPAFGLGFVALLVLRFFSPLLRGKTLSNVPSVQERVAPWMRANPGFYFIQSDQATFVYPYTVLQTHAWRAGTIPLWNPYNLGGIPLLANGQAGVLYPLRILLYLLVSPAVNHDLFVVLHVFASGVFMFLFMKELRLRLLPALLGATAWMFTSWNSTLMQVEVMLPVIAFLPAALLLIHRASRTRSWRTAAAAGIPLAFMAIGGQLELAAFAFAVCGLYSAALALAPTGPWAQWRVSYRRLIGPVLTIGFGAALASAVLLPTLLNASQGGRQPVSYASFARDNTIAVAHFTHLLAGVTSVTEAYLSGMGVFVGVAPLLLAFVGFFCRRQGAGLGRCLAVGMFLFALGAPVITWLAYHFIPGASRLSSTAYVLWLFDFGVIVLAAVGLDALLDWSHRFRLRGRRRDQLELARWAPIVATIVAVVALGTTAWQLLDYARYINPPFTPRQGKLLYPVTPAVSAIERDARRRPPTEPQRLIGFNAFFGEQSLLFSLEDADGYDSVAGKRVRDLWRAVSGVSSAAILKGGRLAPFRFSGSYYTLFSAGGTQYRLLPRVGVTTIVASPAEAQVLVADPKLTAPLRLAPVYVGGDASVFNLVGDEPRGWVVHEADVVRGEPQALQRFTDPAFDYRGRMVVEPDQGLGAPGHVAQRGVGVGADARRDTLAINGTSFTVQTASPGWLVMADMYAPGWHVTVNGRDVNLLRADYTLRAVPVPAGRSRVVLTYRPPGFVPGLVISALAVAALVWIGILALKARRRRGIAGASDQTDPKPKPRARRAPMSSRGRETRVGPERPRR